MVMSTQIPYYQVRVRILRVINHLDLLKALVESNRSDLIRVFLLVSIESIL